MRVLEKRDEELQHLGGPDTPVIDPNMQGEYVSIQCMFSVK